MHGPSIVSPTVRKLLQRSPSMFPHPFEHASLPLCVRDLTG